MEKNKDNVDKSYSSLKHSLLLWFLLVALLPLGFVSWFSYRQASLSLMTAAEERLVQSSSLSIQYFKSWFKYRIVDLNIQSESQKNTEFLQLLEKGLKKSKKPLKEYVKSYDWLKRVTERQDDLITLSRRYDYISDIYMLDLEGNILFSVAKKTDLGANIFSGEYANTLFAKSVEKTAKTGEEIFSDLERYPPLDNAIVGFLTAPLIDELGNKQGVFAIQIRIDNVFRVLKNSKVGRGHQVFYLVGEDGRLRTSIKNEKKEILNRVINTEQIKLWHEHHDIKQDSEHTQAIRYIGPDGVEVIGIHYELNLPGVNWVLISEVESSEALKAASLLAHVTLVLLLITAIIVFLLVYYLSGRITLPIVKLADASMKIAAGDKTQRVEITARNEIGRLAEAFNHMLKMRQIYEQKLKDSFNELSEQKFVLDQHSIVAITDVRGNIIFANEKFSEISGYSKAELIGQNHRLLKSGYHPVEFFKKMYRTIASGKVWNNEVCNKAKNGDLYWVDTTIVPFLGEDGKPERYIAIRTDVTARKQTEAELIEAKNIAENALMAKGQFLASMSHEIRTPMNGVLGMLSLLQNTELNDEQQHRLNVAQSSASSLLCLINDILDYSKVDAGKLELEIIDFNLRSMLGDLSEIMAYQAQAKGLEFILDVKGIEHTMVKGDPGRLRQIITNLVSNAIKFTSEGEVVIRIAVHEYSGNKLTLNCSVSDTGIGIAADKLNKLFDSFSQVDSSTTRKYGGTGLGLAIAKKLCQLMGGDTSVVSEEGVGSCFEFNIFLEKSEQSQLVMPEFNISKLRLLIVDDNNTSREVLCGQLESWGATVVEAGSGAEALQICERYAQQSKPLFDIALLDMQMPVMDGVELGRKLKADKRFCHIKLVMMTSMGQQGNAQLFSDLGFSAYFPKPATTSDLFDTLSVVTGDVDTLYQTKPLAEQDYSGTLNCDSSLQKFQYNKIAWPEHCRLLLVEDNHVNQLVATGILNEMGLQADIAANGLEAIYSLQHAPENAPYTLILMDCQMPKMDGYDATRAIRAAKAGERNKSIVIIAMTANAMQGDREKCVAAGMNDYLTKPVDVDKLLEKLIQWVPGVQDQVIDKQVEVMGVVESAEKSDLIWDKKAALERILGKQDLLKKLIGIFINETPLRMAELKKSIIENDFEKIHMIAHTLKGVVAILGGLRMQQQAELIEVSAKELSPEKINSLMPDFEEAVKQLMSCFEEYMILSESKDYKKVSVLDDGALNEKLKGLIVRLQNSDYIDPDEIEPLLRAGKNALVQSLLSELCEHITQFDNDAALKTIGEIILQVNLNMQDKQKGKTGG